MTNQTIPADRVKKLAARFRQQMEPHTPFAECEVWELAAEAVETLLTAPPTLADMTPAERAACRRMQADVEGRTERYVIVNPYDAEGDAALTSADGEIEWFSPERITPRPDLPRLEWPGTEKPAPDLPVGWRVADHKENGRVIVTNTNPDRDGRVYYMLASENRFGYDSLFCYPEDLTYLDQ